MKKAERFSQLHPIELYWHNLGRFVSDFAQLEGTLNMYFNVLIGLDFRVAGALFGAQSLEQCLVQIRKIRAVLELQESETMKRMFAQVHVIKNERNRILHYGANFTEADTANGVVSNILRTMPGKERKTRVSPETLEQMSADISTIQSGVVVAMVDDLAARHPEFPSPDVVIGAFRKGAERAWQYKPTEV